MKKVISKLDKKEYYLCVATYPMEIDNGLSNVCEGEKYQVRKATAEDCEDYENYCVVNGTFNVEKDVAWNNKFGINVYKGTYRRNVLLSVDFCRKAFKYID